LFVGGGTRVCLFFGRIFDLDRYLPFPGWGMAALDLRTT